MDVMVQMVGAVLRRDLIALREKTITFDRYRENAARGYSDDSDSDWY